MEVIYVIGKYRGKNKFEVVQNIEHAREVAELLWQQDWAVICPHTNSAWMDGIVPDQAFLDGGLEIMERCDAVCLCEGWEESAGSLVEVAVATESDKQILYERDVMEENLTVHQRKY